MNRQLSCEQIHGYFSGYANVNTRKYGKPDDVPEEEPPDVSDDDQALFEQLYSSGDVWQQTKQ